jgi:hypothetical protein
MPKMNAFAIQEGLIKTIEQAVSAYGLKSLPGSDGEVEVLENVETMCKGYKDGTSLPFTATVKCIFDPEKTPAPAAAVVDAEVIDAEVIDAEVIDAEVIDAEVVEEDAPAAEEVEVE